MKTKYLMIAAAATLLAACSNDENEVNDGPVEARITAGIAGPQTRAVGTQWNVDAIGVMVTNATGSYMKDLYKNVKYTTTSTSTQANFTPAATGIFFQDSKETVTFAAYAPYQQSDANALPGTNGAVPVNTADNNGNNQESIDFLYASGATASRGNSTVTFADKTSDGCADCSFKHKMARLDLVLRTSTSDGLKVDYIFDANTFKLSGLKHAGTFNVTTGLAAVNADATTIDNWDFTACKNTKDMQTNYTLTYSLILLPQDASTSGLPLTINIAGQDYKNTGDIKPNLEAGHSYTYTITVKKTGLVVSGCTITDWNSGGTGSGSAEME